MIIPIAEPPWPFKLRSLFLPLPDCFDICQQTMTKQGTFINWRDAGIWAWCSHYTSGFFFFCFFHKPCPMSLRTPEPSVVFPSPLHWAFIKTSSPEEECQHKLLKWWHCASTCCFRFEPWLSCLMALWFWCLPSLLQAPPPSPVKP